MAINITSYASLLAVQRQAGLAEQKAALSLAKLSAGSRVLSARDAAAAMAVGSRISAEASAMRQASSNTFQAKSVLQIADGAFSAIGDIMVRMKTLAVQAGSDNLSDQDRANLETEFSQLRSEIDRISKATTVANSSLDTATSFSVKVGTGAGAADDIAVSFPAVSADALNLNPLTLASAGDADTAVTVLNRAIETLNTGRSLIGAGQNRLEAAGNNLAISSENAEASRSNLLDLDAAAESTRLANQQARLRLGLSNISEGREQLKSFIDILV